MDFPNINGNLDHYFEKGDDSCIQNRATQTPSFHNLPLGNQHLDQILNEQYIGYVQKVMGFIENLHSVSIFISIKNRWWDSNK